MSEVKGVRIVKSGKDDQNRQVWELQIELPDECAMNWRLTSTTDGTELVYVGQGPLVPDHWHPDIYSIEPAVEAVLDAFKMLAMDRCLDGKTGRFDGGQMRHLAEKHCRIHISYPE